MRNTIKALGAAVMLLVVPLAALADGDEFMRQDRWQTTTWQFQDGYAMGVWDTVQDLADFPADVRAYIPLLLRRADTCLHSMPRIADVSAFASRAIARISNPQQNVISSVVSGLGACAPVNAPSNSTVDATGGTFMWKGRWENDREYFARDDLHDGYASGVADVLRYLDNTGKTPSALVQDVVDAGKCSTVKTVDDLADLVGPAIAAHKDDSSGSISGVIFDAILACGRIR
ncbi:MAG TPA: hypothetical protein VEP50_09375 [bacterium]|nr:hypothetical protein [bacterium]